MASTALRRLPKCSAAILSPSRYPLSPTICTLPYSNVRSYICADTLVARRTLITTLPRLAEGDLGNPQSTSSEQSSVKTSRATEGRHSPDTASVQQPVSDQSAIPGEKDEGTPTEDEVKRDPSEPAESKRKHVEKQGDKPLGPEDHQ